MELLQLLTQDLGISHEQARSGAGMLFKLAKDKLGSGDFQQVAAAVPGVEDLLKATPAGGGMAGALGGMLSSMGGGAGKLGDLAGLAAGFSKLGLDSSMVGRFIPVILSFVQTKGGSAVKDLLAGVLK